MILAYETYEAYETSQPCDAYKVKVRIEENKENNCYAAILVDVFEL